MVCSTTAMGMVVHIKADMSVSMPVILQSCHQDQNVREHLALSSSQLAYTTCFASILQLERAADMKSVTSPARLAEHGHSTAAIICYTQLMSKCDITKLSMKRVQAVPPNLTTSKHAKVSKLSSCLVSP